MKKEATIMAMPVRINVVDDAVAEDDIEEIFTYLRQIDEKFSTYKETSETQKLNRGEISEQDLSPEMKEVLALSDETKKETRGFFDVKINHIFDPLGLVKGWAIYKAAEMLARKGYHNFYLEIAGDIEVRGHNERGEKWRIGIENPFNRSQIIKVVELSDAGIATSGTYIRGKHIFNPINGKDADEIMSMTVIAENVYEADRFATAAFAMGKVGINFLESKTGLEGMMVTKDKRLTETSGFKQYLVQG